MVLANRSFRLTLLGAMALAAVSVTGVATANATVFSATATLTDYSTGNTALTFTTRAEPFVTTGGVYTPAIVSLTTTDTTQGSQTDQVYLTLSWTEPSTGVLQFAQFNGTVDQTNNGNTSTGDINWGVPSRSDSYGNYVAQNVRFADGTTGMVKLYDTTLSGTGTSLTGQVAVQVVDTPEPMSIALFGVGIIGLGVVARRHPARCPQATA
ncbi:PEP-CTERM sorting domain-containing protein [Rhodopila sp.]|uniref:PEP-CTERM sorting domain-containing protein n=1 Tax=Rhodopila sp. TaxID=2480087 RepID=UPI003D0F30C4